MTLRLAFFIGQALLLSLNFSGSAAAGGKAAETRDDDCGSLLLPAVTFVSHDSTPLADQFPTDPSVAASRAAIRDLARRLKEMIGDELPFPQRIFIERSSRGSWVNVGNENIELSVEYFPKAIGANAARVRRISEIVLAHEIGHLILKAMLRKLIPDVLELVEMADREIQERQLQMELRQILIPYEELFADSVAVAFFADGRAPAEPLVGSEEAPFRDFTAGIPAIGWSYEGPYAFFTPARSLVWQKLLSGATEAQSRGPARALRILAQAIASEISRRVWASPPSHGQSVHDPEAANVGLGEAIDAAVAAAVKPLK